MYNKWIKVKVGPGSIVRISAAIVNRQRPWGCWVYWVVV